MSYEAVIDGNEIDTIDPVVRIIIDNGFHRYELAPEDVSKIEIRAGASQPVDIKED